MEYLNTAVCILSLISPTHGTEESAMVRLPDMNNYCFHPVLSTSRIVGEKHTSLPDFHLSAARLFAQQAESDAVNCAAYVTASLNAILGFVKSQVAAVTGSPPLLIEIDKVLYYLEQGAPTLQAEREALEGLRRQISAPPLGGKAFNVAVMELLKPELAKLAIETAENYVQQVLA